MKARDSSLRKIYEKYLKLTRRTDDEHVQNELYQKYINTLKKVKVDTVDNECVYCGNNAAVFGACCPFCCRSLLVPGKE